MAARKQGSADTSAKKQERATKNSARTTKYGGNMQGTADAEARSRAKLAKQSEAWARTKTGNREVVKGNRVQSTSTGSRKLHQNVSEVWPIKASDALQGGRKRTTSPATTRAKAAKARRAGGR